MASCREIERLAEFDALGSQVLRVELDLDPATQVRHAYPVAFEHLVKNAGYGNGQDTKRIVANEQQTEGTRGLNPLRAVKGPNYGYGGEG